MQKRLISENMLQLPSQATSTFSSYASFIAYRTDTSIRIKTLSKDIREYDIKIASSQANNQNNAKQDPVKRYYFCAHKAVLILALEYAQKFIELYQVEITGNQVRCRVRGKIDAAEASVGIPNGIGYIYDGKIVKAYNFDTNNSTSICQCTPLSKLLQHQGNHIFLLSPCSPSSQPQTLSTIRMFTFDPLTPNHYSQSPLSPLSLNYSLNPICIYKDRYIFNHLAGTKQIQIINLYETVIVGKFQYQGQFIHAVVRNGVLLIVSSKENMDKYYFYTLKASLYSSNSNNGGQADGVQNRAIFTHRSVYQKGKGAGFEMFCTGEQYADAIVQGKVNFKDLDKINSRYNSNIIGEQVLLIYVQPSKKNKLQILKVSASKIREEAFKQKESNTIILSKQDTKQKGLSQKKVKADKQQLEIEKARLGASMNHRKSQKSIQEMQKKIIDHVVDIKIRGLMEKFESLERRLISIEDHIAIIYKKIQKSIQNINRDEIRRNVEGLFERVTPQFESYFKQVFRQISGVLDQGMNYYTTKLAKESEIHRDAFNQIINMTFDAAQQIAEIGRKELKHSEKTSQDIQKLLQIRKRWENQTSQLSQAFRPRPGVDEVNVGINLNLQSPNNLSTDKKGSPQGKNKKN